MRGLPGWDVFALTYSVDEPIATVLDGAAMQAYQRVAKLLWLLKRAEHSLNEAWVNLNGLQRQLSAFPTLLRRTGLRAYSEAPTLAARCPICQSVRIQIPNKCPASCRIRRSGGNDMPARKPCIALLKQDCVMQCAC